MTLYITTARDREGTPFYECRLPGEVEAYLTDYSKEALLATLHSLYPDAIIETED